MTWSKFQHRFRYGIHEFFYTLLTFPRAWRFMLHHRLWEGLRQYGWVARALVVIGLLAGLFVASEVIDWFDNHDQISLYAATVGPDSIIRRLWNDLYESLSDGVLNWVILVLLEVVIYHFMRRSLYILLSKAEKDAHTFKPFFNAQKRMVIVSLMGVILQETLLGIGDGLIPSFLFPIFSVAAQSTILGYAIADNYNEQFDLTVKQSIRHIWRNYIGICAGLGLPLFLMLKVPLLGAMIGPLVTSVTAAIVLREKSDLHIIGYQMSEKERSKAEKLAAKQRAKEERKAAKRRRSTPQH